jgi:dTDP-4-dehydrorhamnose reductase
VTRLLVTGGSGLLGGNLVMAARERHAVTALCHQHPIAVDGVECLRMDLTRPAAADEAILKVRPEWIIHCAAAADVDRCEDNPAWAVRLNVEMARNVAEASARAGARLVHISTDAVFDGERGRYREGDTPRPHNVYGATKLEGERAVLVADPRALILRVNFFGWHPWGQRGLAEWFLTRLEKGQPAPGFVDVLVTPMLVNDLAERILTVAGLPLSGVYHLAGSECLSKYEFGRRLAMAFGFDPELIRPAHVAEAGLRAARARRLCLDSSNLGAAASLSFPALAAGLARFRDLREEGYADRLKKMVAVVARAGGDARSEVQA